MTLKLRVYVRGPRIDDELMDYKKSLVCVCTLLVHPADPISREHSNLSADPGRSGVGSYGSSIQTRTVRCIHLNAVSCRFVIFNTTIKIKEKNIYIFNG